MLMPTSNIGKDNQVDNYMEGHHNSRSNSHCDTWISGKKKRGYLILLSIRYLIHHHEENVQVSYDDIL